MNKDLRDLPWVFVHVHVLASNGCALSEGMHWPVYPPNAHDCWDRERIITLLTAHEHVAAYFSGHNHAGNFGTLEGCHFLNFKGMVDTETENTFAIVEIWADRIEVHGFGREDSRTLKLR